MFSPKRSGGAGESSYDPERAERAPLVHPSVANDDDDDDDFSAFRSFPTGSSVRGNTGEDERVNVTYVFQPRWPVVGRMEQVVGVLGRDKDETISMVKRAFPPLASFPHDRIQFEVSQLPAGAVGAHPGSGSGSGSTQYPPPQQTEWALCLDEAWPQFRRHPPARMRVMVKDRPGDEARRNRHEIMKGVKISVGIFAGFMLFILICYLTLVGTSGSEAEGTGGGSEGDDLDRLVRRLGLGPDR